MKKVIVLIVLAALALVILAACAPAPTPVPPPVAPTVVPAATVAPTAVPATVVPTKPPLRTKANPGEKITLYHYGDITGPYAAITMPLISGFNDAVKALNAKGGIRGAEVTVEWADTAGKLENAIATYNRFREKKPIILYMYGSTETEGLRDRLAEDKIPNLTFGVSSKGSYPPGWVFAAVPIYSDQFGFFLDWLTANWAKVKPAKGQNTDVPRVSVLTWDTAFGQGALTPETRAYAEKKGVKIISQEFFAVGAPDVTTQILAAKKAGANVIYTNTLAHGPAQVLKDTVSLGVRDEFLIGGDNWALDLSMLALAGAASEGLYGPIPNLWWDDADNAGIKEVEAQFKANNRKPAEHSVGYLLSFAIVDATRQYLEKTIDRVGFDALTGTAVYETLQQPTEIKATDGVLFLQYSKDIRATSKLRVVQVQKGKFVQVGDWGVAPDLRSK